MVKFYQCGLCPICSGREQREFDKALEPSQGKSHCFIGRTGCHFPALAGDLRGRPGTRRNCVVSDESLVVEALDQGSLDILIAHVSQALAKELNLSPCFLLGLQ